jgi:hypothetical protein
MSIFEKFNLIKPDPASILARRSSGEIYSADFGNGAGKYISCAIDSTDPYDVSIKISPKIEVRLTYIIENKEVSGIQISKLDNQGHRTDMHLSTLDWQGVLTILHIFSEMDLSAVAHKSLIIEGGLAQDPESLKKFLNTVAADQDGRDKMKEILKNFNAIRKGDINEAAERNGAVKLFETILNDSEKFKLYKEKLGVGKNEEVWQRFFERNSWILGSDFVEILDERVLDEDNICDLPVKDYDGFVNIIELKLQTEDFWTQENNPTANLTKAIMQCMRYITETERRMNDKKKTDKLGANILKPRITLLFGRSDSWSDEHKEQFKILNSSFHNISILTYDHVLNRAKKIIEPNKNSYEI